MKKLLALLLALALMLTFAACTVKDDAKDDKDKAAVATKGDEGDDKLDDSSDSESNDKQDNNKDNNNDSSEGAAWDDDYYNNVVIHWTDALGINDYTNFTLSMDVKSEQLGDSAQSIAFNGDSATIDGESFSDAESVAILKENCLGIVLDLLKSANMEYDYKTQLYTSSYALCEFSMEEASAYITAYDIEFYIDRNMHVTHFSCRMEQEITSPSGDVTNISVEKLTVTISDFGTTK